MRQRGKLQRTTVVGFLTSVRGICHKFGGQLVSVCLTVAAGTAVLSPTQTFAAAGTEWQQPETILAAAEDFIKESYGRNDSRMKPRAGHLDARLHLPKCSAALEAFVRRGTKITSRTIVGVRCTGVKPWKVYVPVDVIVTESVLVTRRTLPKGHLLTPADVVREERDISLLRGGYMATIEELDQKRLKRQVDAGRVLAPSMLVADILVRRGQMVTLIVKSDQINIRMAGRALSDGALNQRIRVENLNSERVVEGFVRSPEHVEILVR